MDSATNPSLSQQVVMYGNDLDLALRDWHAQHPDSYESGGAIADILDRNGAVIRKKPVSSQTTFLFRVIDPSCETSYLTDSDDDFVWFGESKSNYPGNATDNRTREE